MSYIKYIIREYLMYLNIFFYNLIKFNIPTWVRVTGETFSYLEKEPKRQDTKSI